MLIGVTGVMVAVVGVEEEEVLVFLTSWGQLLLLGFPCV